MLLRRVSRRKHRRDDDDVGADSTFYFPQPAGTPIIAVTPLETTARRMALQWGVESLIVPNFHSTDDMIAGTIAAVCRNGLEVGDKRQDYRGVPFNVTGLTNFAKAHEMVQDIEALDEPMGVR